MTDLFPNPASFGYDGLHRLTAASGLWGSYTYQYDAFNNLTARSSGASTWTYGYDAASGRLSGVTSVTVLPPQVQLSASPASITAGGSSTLSWSSSNASACSAADATCSGKPVNSQERASGSG